MSICYSMIAGFVLKSNCTSALQLKRSRKSSKSAVKGFSGEYNILFFKYDIARLVFSRFLDLRGNLGIVKEKPTRKTCFSRKKKHLAPRIYQAKFCLAPFLWSQRNLYYIFMRNRCWNEGEYILKGLITKTLEKAL